jgi:asparagine synthase (glutamine-hydrolysing)
MQWAGEQPSKASPLGRRLSKALQFADESAQRRLAGYFVWLRSDLLDGLLSPEIRQEIADWDVLEPLLEENRQLPDRTPALNRMLNLDTRFFLADHNLNYTDKMSMATGVEVRVPFLDPDLVGLAARMPLEFKQRGAVGKWVLKEAMKPHLPERVINRPKAGFGVPLREWMSGELGRTLRELLSPEAINRRGLFDAQGVRSLIEQDRAGRIDAAYPIFALACVEMWCRQFLDAKNP